MMDHILPGVLVALPVSFFLIEKSILINDMFLFGDDNFSSFNLKVNSAS